MAGSHGLALPYLQERLMMMIRWAKPQPVTFKGQWGKAGWPQEPRGLWLWIFWLFSQRPSVSMSSVLTTGHR